MFIRLIGFITLAVSLYVLIKRFAQTKSWTKTTGRAVSHQEEKTIDVTETNEYVVIEFSLPDGETVQSECSWMYKKAFKPDLPVPIRYNPADPSQVLVIWWVKDWGALYVMALIGLGLILYADG